MAIEEGGRGRGKGWEVRGGRGGKELAAAVSTTCNNREKSHPTTPGQMLRYIDEVTQREYDRQANTAKSTQMFCVKLQRRNT